jgi:hypothetical protein
MSSTKNANPVKINMANWNKAVRTARTASAKVDGFNWLIGDLALSVATEYGENKIGKFSDEISQEVTSVRNMRTVSAAYPATDDVVRTLQSWTVYAVFASQDDRDALVKHGNEGNKWTVSAARALVKSRKDGDETGNGNDETGGDETGNSDETVTRDKLVANITRLESALEDARVKLAEYDAAHATPATDAPKVAKHTVRGIPAHKSDEPRADCPKCKLAAAPAA